MREKKYSTAPIAKPTRVSSTRPHPGMTRSATQVWSGCSINANGPVVMSLFFGTFTRICTTDAIQSGTPTTSSIMPITSPARPVPIRNMDGQARFAAIAAAANSAVGPMT
jgi:hypothetical protein